MSRTILIQGDARNLPLASGSVHCIITSPPYWSLRDYGLPPSIWGAEPDCIHDWSPPLKNHKGGPQGASGDRSDRDVSAQNAAQDTQAGMLCLRCNAWRGFLGLEPTPTLYVAHMVEVFRECRRVLRDDGTLWLNIGDSYNAQPGQRKATDKAGPKQASNRGSVGIGSRSVRKGLDCDPKRGAAAVGQPMKQSWEAIKAKDLVGIPWMLAFALRADGWYLRQEIIWHKPNAMPASVTDRCTTAHESLFLLTKRPRYFFDADAIREPGARYGWNAQQFKGGDKTRHHGNTKGGGGSPIDESAGRNKRSVWKISTQPCKEAHFATFPVKLALPCIKAGTSEKGVCPACGAPWKRVVERIPRGDWNENRKRTGDQMIHRNDGKNCGAEFYRNWKPPVTTHWLPTCKCPPADPIYATVLDPFSGAATTGVACLELGRNFIGVERKFEYLEISRRRLAAWVPRSDRSKRKRPAPDPAQIDLFGATGQ